MEDELETSTEETAPAEEGSAAPEEAKGRKPKKPKKEKKAKEGGKSKGKLPVILLLAIALGGGGFFGMKILKGGAKKAEVPVVGSVVPLKEFLVNLGSDRKVWLKTEIALGIAKGQEKALDFGGGKKGKDAGDPPQIRDAVNMLLMSRTAKELSTIEGKQKLKAEIIKTLNQLLNKSPGHPTENLENSDKETHGPDSKSPADDAGAANSGPVLEVYFISFAMQDS